MGPGGPPGGGVGGSSNQTSLSLEEALKVLDKSGLRPGQTEISRSRIMEIIENFDTVRATSSIYQASDGTRYLVEGHHTTVAATMLGKSGPYMGQPTAQPPSATNVYWTKAPWEFWKTAIKIIP